MRKLILMVVVCLVLMGARGFDTILNPKNPLSCDEAEATQWSFTRRGDTWTGGEYGTVSEFIRPLEN